jgi:hypothetical protein
VCRPNGSRCSRTSLPTAHDCRGLDAQAIPSCSISTFKKTQTAIATRRRRCARAHPVQPWPPAGRGSTVCLCGSGRPGFVGVRSWRSAGARRPPVVSVVALPDAIVRLSNSEIRTAYWCLATMIRARRHDVPRPVADLYDRLDAEIRVSACGQQSSCDTQDSGTLSTMQVAEVLRRSEKWVRRHRELLGGHKDGDRWRYPRATVAEYEGRAADA